MSGFPDKSPPKGTYWEGIYVCGMLLALRATKKSRTGKTRRNSTGKKLTEGNFGTLLHSLEEHRSSLFLAGLIAVDAWCKQRGNRGKRESPRPGTACRGDGCWLGSISAELRAGAPEPGADLLHAVVLGPAVRRGCVHGLASFLGERRAVVGEGLRQRRTGRRSFIHPAACARQLKGELTRRPIVSR